eukprot:Protomagalhaensia_wolfi_Nauph_80__3899@NODE_3957_length_670_cov_25_488114_g3135_i0_p1_GENE_NODE_3957_length_670_cov_25_488114_g3135_i0NODE_3957_length_670_cov_25_488114_g3135_i0_p1_ORF_typecomplete_len141_score14_31_NODE_3957_length_670_cov_25_488114_g3135_i0172594
MLKLSTAQMCKRDQPPSKAINLEELLQENDLHDDPCKSYTLIPSRWLLGGNSNFSGGVWSTPPHIIEEKRLKWLAVDDTSSIAHEAKNARIRSEVVVEEFEPQTVQEEVAMWRGAKSPRFIYMKRCMWSFAQKLRATVNT